MTNERLFSTFETWPDAVFYAPVFLYWLWLSLRYRGATLPTIANVPPALSGFLGESKSDVLGLLGPRGRAHVAPYTAFVAGTIEEAEGERARAGLEYPLVAKPDLGQNGNGVKIVRNKDALARYLATFPRGAKVILQKYIEQEGEAGVFYVREPDAAKGRVVSLTLKYLPYVEGDGVKTLRELIEADPRASRIKHLYFVRHGARLEEVVSAGERVRLVSVGNHCKGAIFKNGAAHITSAMADAFDAIAKEIPGFHLGRFDVRYGNLEDLKKGEGFTILEVNGADSEMTHVWDADETILGAYRALFNQYKLAFSIGAANRARGSRPATAREFLGAWRRNNAMFAQYTREE